MVSRELLSDGRTGDRTGLIAYQITNPTCDYSSGSLVHPQIQRCHPLWWNMSGLVNCDFLGTFTMTLHLLGKYPLTSCCVI